MKNGKQYPNIMICSGCGSIMAAKTDSKTSFNTKASWGCKGCKQVWDESDGWVEIGNLLIPHKGEWIG